MKRVGNDIRNTLKRVATVITTTVVGLTFVLVSSAAGGLEDKKVLVIKKPEVVKIVKPEAKEDSKAFFDRDRAFFNRGLFADDDRVFFDRRPFFRPFFGFDDGFFEED